MKKQLIAILYILPLLLWSNLTQASSLDDLYRDIMRSDNQGYLPLFVKNRKTPDILGIASSTSEVAPLEIKTASKTNEKSVNLVNYFPEKEAAKKAKQLKWEQTLKAIKQNHITPVELDEIHHRLHLNDPKAIEILAWMYTKGVGVQIDYVEAYKLYRKAAMLNVPQAKENALLVYKAMNDRQRKKIKNY
ncbi:MAG: SEL1-like repeat protein [Alphaproteobacteria bacterium]|nr:SEL1-like repeat protein [Alphaproteobacteria bacterium]